MLRKIETLLEQVLFGSRWALAPLYLGLLLTLFILMLKFGQELFHIFGHMIDAPGTTIILDVLSLVDIVLIANLILMIVFSGYENFVSKIDMGHGHVDRPEWMGKVDYSALKLKVIGSVVAISSIELLRAFMSIEGKDKTDLGWMVGIHLTFVLSGVLFALMENLSHGKPKHSQGE